jgi:Tfp pilus assembly protein PilF
MKHSFPSSVARLVLPLVVGLWFHPVSSPCQDSSAEGTIIRGTRTELAVTVYDSAGQIVRSSTTIKLYKDGVAVDQASTSEGRVFFVSRSSGDFTIAVEAAGYKSAQKDVTVEPSVKTEIAVYVQAILPSNESVGVPGKPQLAPKAKEALVKALQAMDKKKLDEAQKHLSEAVELAPSDPEVLYVEGLLFLERNDWLDAQTALQKSDQIEPNQARVLAALGLALCNQKSYQQAIPPLEKSLQLSPAASWKTEWTLAKSYYHDGQYEQALKMAQQAKSHTHEATPQLDLLLAQCLTAVGRYEDSAQVLRDFLKYNPSGADAATARRWLDGLVANGKINPASNPIPNP